MAFSKPRALESWGPAFDPRTHMEMLSMVAHICKPNSGKTGQISEVCWTDSLAYLVSSNERPCLKEGVSVSERDTWGCPPASA